MNLLDLFVKVGVDDQASSQVETLGRNITSKLGSAVKTVGKVMAGVAAGAGAGAIAITKAAVDSYASYEQLVGGVDKLYQKASGKLQQYAQNAYKTAGMSANDYMEQATSFSAALINSLGGDVDKAADQTDKAMRLMSDNVNTFGSDAEAVQNAIQGLSRANFTMIDNLKLGYAGSREGMQNLIADAEKYAKTVKGMGFEEYARSMAETGMSADELRKRYDELTNSTDLSIDSFSDMIDAIDIIQEKQHIMGTTSREAMTTIEGSVNATKAAWDNLLTAFGSGDQTQIQTAVGGIISGIFGTWNDETKKREGGVINNVLPVVQRVGDAILQQAPSIASRFAYSLVEGFASSVLGMDNVGAQEFADGIFEKIEDFSTKATNVFNTVSTAVQGFLDSFGGTVDLGYVNVAIDKVGSIIQSVWGFVEQNILPHMPEIGEALGNIVNFLASVATTALTVIDNLSPFVPMILGAVGALGALQAVTGIIGAVSGAVTFFTTVLVPALGMIQSIPGLIAVVTTVLGGPVTIIAAIVGAIVAFLATNEDARAKVLEVWEMVKQKFFEVKDAIGQKLKEIGQFFGDLKSGAEEKLNEVIDFFRNLPENIKNALGDLTGTLKQAGLDIIGGFFGGLQDKWNEVSGWVEGIGGWIADHKGPKAYDLGLLVDNGKWIMQSLQTGLEKGLPPVEDTLRDITDSIQTGINTNVGVTAMQAPNRDAAILNALGAIRDNMNMSVVLDSGALVGGIAPTMNTALGRL